MKGEKDCLIVRLIVEAIEETESNRILTNFNVNDVSSKGSEMTLLPPPSPSYQLYED